MPVAHRVGVGWLAPLMLAVTACSGDSSDDGEALDPVTVDITEQGGQLDPIGEVVQVKTGQDVTLVVTSDVDDEIHVHSDPEHEFAVTIGDREKEFTFSVDIPGTVEVESHAFEVTLIKLEVS